MKKYLAILLVLAMVLGMIPAVSAEAPAAIDLTANLVGNASERVDAVEVAERTCFMYVPESNRIGNFLGLTPIIAVFGSGKYADEAAVMAAAHEGGFAEIAQRDGICVLFVNPLESWDSEADRAAAADLFAGINNTYISDPTVDFVDGVGHYVRKDADGNVIDERDVSPGSLHGLQFFGEGIGADYIQANFTTPNTYNGGYSVQFFEGLSGIPSGMGLFAPTALTECADGAVIPMAIVNGPENAQAVADSFNNDIGISKVVTAEGVTGFDAALVIELYDEVISKYYYSQGQFRENPKYRENGILEANGWVSMNEETPLEYYAYIPDDLDLSAEGSIPCLFWMHGFGGEGEAMLSWTEWPLIGKEEGFMVVSLDQITNFAYTGEMFMNAIDGVIEQFPCIDTGRIYLGGFSFGSYNTWKTALQYSSRFAAIIPDALGLFSADPAIDAALPEGEILPTFYIAGGQSPMELGSSAMTQAALTALWQLNGLGEYVYDEAYEWGAPADTVKTIAYKDYSDGVLDDSARQQYLTISSFESEDGNTYTWLAVNQNKPHTITNNDAHIVWEYIRNFYRDADGRICIVEETAAGSEAAKLADGMTGNTRERVDAVEVAGRTCYMYVPESSRVGNFLCLTPIVAVLGDEAYTEETALTAAQESFSEIARRDGLCILFVNPVDSWDSEADAAAIEELFAGIYDLYSSRPSLEFADGLAHMVLTDKEGNVTADRMVYPGSLHGLQIFAEGRGADYAAANLTSAHTYDANYSMTTYPGLAGYPSGMALFAPTTLTENTEATIIPMAVVNGPENALSFAQSYNVNAGVCKTVRAPEAAGFTQELVTGLYDEILTAYYYSLGQFRIVPAYHNNGMVEVNAAKTTADGKVIEYYAYIPEDLDITEEASVPLLMYFHGGGGEAEGMVSWTDWPLVAQEYGFVVVSFDQHGAYTSHDVIDILDQLLAEYTFLDPGRVYAGGFSMGGGKTWNLAVKYPDRLAGVIPTAAGTMGEGTDVYTDFVKSDVIVPAFYIAGGVSFLPELPTEEGNNVNELLGYLWTMNSLGEFTFDAGSASRWHTDPAAVTTICYRDDCDSLLGGTKQQLAISEFPSADGNVYTYLCINAYKSHALTNNDAHIAWTYISRFARNADGSISIIG